METTPEKAVLGVPFTLGVTRRAVFKEGLDIVVEDIIFEDIAADPEDEAGYPSGNGVNVKLVLNKGKDHISISLSKLSKGYDSKAQETWKGHKISLLDVIEKSGEHAGWESYAILQVDATSTQLQHPHNPPLAGACKAVQRIARKR